MTIRGKTWQPQLQNCQNQSPHTSEIGYLLPICLKTIGVEPTMFPSRMQNFVKTSRQCERNRSRTDKIDTEIDRILHLSNIRIIFLVLIKTEYKVNALILTLLGFL